MKHEQNKSFLGQGWSFPVTFSEESGVDLVNEAEDIRQSLRILLTTPVGDRVTHPDFGCNIHEIVFDPVNQSTAQHIRRAIDKAILYFEPRITLENINLDISRHKDGILRISLDYVIRKVNIRSNAVFPYYLNEGTIILDKF